MTRSIHTSGGLRHALSGADRQVGPISDFPDRPPPAARAAHGGIPERMTGKFHSSCRAVDRKKNDQSSPKAVRVVRVARRMGDDEQGTSRREKSEWSEAACPA